MPPKKICSLLEKLLCEVKKGEGCPAKPLSINHLGRREGSIKFSSKHRILKKKISTEMPWQGWGNESSVDPPKHMITKTFQKIIKQLRKYFTFKRR